VLLEAKHVAGGACRTRYFQCGCYVNTAATVFGLFSTSLRKTLEKDLESSFFSTDIVAFDPELVALTPNGWIPAFADAVRTAVAVAAKTSDSSDNILEYLDVVATASAAAKCVWVNPHGDRHALRRVLTEAVGPDLAALFLLGSVRDLLRRFFEDPATRALFLATNVLTPTWIGRPGSALPMRYLAQAEALHGSWGLVSGGYARLIDLLKRGATHNGVEVRLGVEVRDLILKRGKVTHIRTSTDDEIDVDAVVSAIDPVRTAGLAPSTLRADQDALRAKWSSGGIAKVNMLLNEPLALQHVRDEGVPTVGQLVFGSSEWAIAEGYSAWRRGRMPDRPYIEVFPLYEVDELASCGRHFPVCALFLFVPYSRSDDQNAELRRKLLGQLCTALKATSLDDDPIDVEWVEVMTPRDIELRFSMFQGNPDHGAMDSTNLLEDRPLRGSGWRGASTPLPNLFLASAGAHPGGLVTGMPGEMAVPEVQEYLDRLGASAST